MPAYYTILTNVGQAKIANAIALNQTVNWAEMAVGDGNGNPTTPVQTQTDLVREKYRASINQLTVDPDNSSYLIAEMIVPSNVGGWSVYEVGIFDDDGDLIAVANFPATYKPQLAEGSTRDLVVRIIIEVSNAAVVTLKIDPAIVLASRKWVADNYLLRSKVAGGTTGQVLAKSSNAAEAFTWIDPTAAVNVIVDAQTEKQTLAASQVVVTLATLTTQGIAVYIEGARLIETADFTITSSTVITLATSYPAGTRIHMYQNDPTSTIADASETDRGFIKLATDAQALGLSNDTAAITPEKLKLVLDSIFPIGFPAMWPDDTPPDGWLELDGSALSRTTYAALFAVLGTKYGAGDGSTTFNLPDDRGLFWRGWDHSRGYDTGRTHGSEQADEVKSHTHTGGVNGWQASVGAGGGMAIADGLYSPTGAYGGTETRPKNRAYLPIMRAY